MIPQSRRSCLHHCIVSVRSSNERFGRGKKRSCNFLCLLWWPKDIGTNEISVGFAELAIKIALQTNEILTKPLQCAINHRVEAT